MTWSVKTPLRYTKGLFFMAMLCLPALVRPVAAPEPAYAPVQAAPMQVWNEKDEVTLKGDKLEFLQESQVMKGQGGVEIAAGTMRLRAEKIYLDLRSNTLEAEGRVIWADSGNTVYAERVVVNLKTRLGHAEKLLFRRDSWSAWGDSAQKESDQDFSLSDTQASSCLRERPHYRIVASSIRLKVGEKVTAKNVRVYVGVVPVLYLPSYSQSLKDPRPPFEIRPGYNKASGAFLRTAYNYYLNDENWGSLRFDWMDKQGTGYGLSHHYEVFGGKGEASGYYTRDKNNPDNQSWTGNFRHRQEFSKSLRLLANADFISQYLVNQQYDLNRVDTFQNRKFVSLQSGGRDYNWNLDVSETQALQRRLGNDPSQRDYVVIQRSLPALGFSRFSRPLIPGSSLYFAVNGSMSRALTVPLSQTATGLPAYDTAAAYETSFAGLTPSLSYSLRLGRLGSLNLNTGFSQSYVRKDIESGMGRGVSVGRSDVTWRLPLGGVSAYFGHRVSRQFSQMETQRFAGLLEHRLSLNSTWSPLESLSLLAGADYDLLPYKTDSDLRRLGLLRMQGLYSPDERRNLMLVSTYDAPTGQFKTVDSNFSVSGPKKRWQTGAGFSWVNNRITQIPGPLDPNAPAIFGYEEPHRTPDQFLATWRASMAVTEHWSLSGYQRLNLASKAVDEQAFSFWRDLHCWDLEIYGRERVYTGWQFGFTLTLRALPQVSASSNKIVSDLFDDASYGY